MRAARARGRRRGAGARARAAPRAPANGAPAASLDDLRRKYRELCAKYEALVTRSSVDVAERVGTVALALSAMRASPSALALVDAARVLFTNARWLELARSSGPLVRLSGSDRLPARGSAQGVADAGTTAVLARGGPDVLAARYGAERGAIGWDVRVERTRYRGRAVAMIIAADASRAIRDERELETARGRMAEQDRLRTVGLLAAGVAHDFANALNGAGLHLGLVAAEEAALPEAARGHLQALRRVLTSMAERTRRLRELALERQELVVERVELAPVVAAAVDLARAEFRARSRATVEIEVQSGLEALPPVRGAGAELTHLLLNLLINARDAMRDGGAIRIHGAAQGDGVTLEVADEGPGIPPEHLARVFEPFFTTKGAGGTGLGLATAYGLMRALGGEITAANRPSRGAVFALRFRRWR